MKTIKMVSAILLLSNFVYVIAFGQSRVVRPTGRLSFDVADAYEDVPIPRAFVYIHNDFRPVNGQDDLAVKLDPKGKAEVALPVRLYTVFVSAGGFAPRTRILEVVPKQTNPWVVRMVADEEHLQQ